jgi:hypothetical protein
MTAYPTAGALKTNALAGTLMRIEQLYLLNGVSHLLAFTTEHLYEYNTTTTTWDCITRGETIEDAEDAWTASANVTAAEDATIKLRGTNSVKLTIAAAFTTGVAAYENFSSDDFSAHTGVHFWIRSSVATDAGDLQLLIDDTNNCVSPLETLDIPALVADTWTPVSLDFATPANLTAVLSVGLNVAVDNGAQIVHIDDVRATSRFTGDEDNRFSLATLNDTMVVTNGIDAPTKVTSGATHAALTLNLVAGAITTCEVVIAFKDHMLFMNNTENGGDAPQRVTWTNIGSITDLTAGTSGFQDMIEDESWVVGAAMLSDNEIAIYKERSVIQCTWVGGQTPFRFRTVLTGSGAVNKDCITETGGGHSVFGPDVTYIYKGTSEIEIVDDDIKRTMYGRLDGAYVDRAFLMYVEEDDELQIWIPVAQTTPDEGYTLDVIADVWYQKKRNISGYGYYQAQSSITIGDLVGTIGEQDWTFGSQLIKQYFPITLVGDVNGKVYSLDKTTLDNDGTAIINEFQTPDFVLPGVEAYLNYGMRIQKLIFEAQGQKIDTFYSTDGGASWSPTQGAGTHSTSLDSVWKDYEQDFEADCRRIRFKFFNDTAASGFHLRHYGFYWQQMSGRK